MTAPFDRFLAAAHYLRPRSAVVLGSGLGDVVAGFHPIESVSFGDVPGLVPPTVAGHHGELLVGTWGEQPAIVCVGRVHFYEGHEWTRVVRLIHLIADLGVKRLLLTNAAGGIHKDLQPGDLMVINRHLKLLDSDAWRAASQFAPQPTPYSLAEELAKLASQNGKQLLLGTYAALTGPCYETPAEIRMLRTLGADAVGMSTAIEAEAAVERGLAVAGLSVITNHAAGLSPGTLSHKEVGENARLAIARLSSLLPMFAAES